MNDIKALKELDMNTLVDMLARKTDEYMRIQREGASPEVHRMCREEIDMIMNEIQERRKD